MKKLVSVMLVCIMAIAMSACSLLPDKNIVINSGNDAESDIDEVKTGASQDYSEVTVGDAFDYYFASPKWSSYKGDGSLDVVEFTGSCIYEDFDMDVLFQFVKDADKNVYTPEFVSFNQIPQTRNTLNEFLDDIFATYADFQNGGKGTGTVQTYSPSKSKGSVKPAAEASDGDYILPGSDREIIDEAILKQMSKKELRLARNEIVARHGCIFNNKELKAYFESKSWYEPKVSSDDFDLDTLNEYESANLKIIRSIEESK